jgi:hypothetical protein
VYTLYGSFSISGSLFGGVHSLSPVVESISGEVCLYSLSLSLSLG